MGHAPRPSTSSATRTRRPGSRSPTPSGSPTSPRPPCRSTRPPGIDTLRERFPVLAGPRSDDICYATQNRQAAVKTLARDCQLVLVIGATNSSNSVRLVEVARAAARPTCPGGRGGRPGLVRGRRHRRSARAPPPSGWSTSSSRPCASGRDRGARGRGRPEDVHFALPGTLRRDARRPGVQGTAAVPVGRTAWRLDGRAGRRRLRRRRRAGRAACARRLHEKGVAATVLEAPTGSAAGSAPTGSTTSCSTGASRSC